MAKQIKKFQYQKRDPGTIKRQANQHGGDFDSLAKDGIKEFKPKEGKNTVRILPPTWDNADHYGYEAHINYNIGVNNRKYFSLSKMKGEKDPLEEAHKQAMREGDKKLADALKPTKRLLYLIIDRNAEEEGPQLWMAPWTFDKKLAALSIDEDTGSVIDPAIDDPDGGCDIRFYYEKTGKQFPDYPAEKMRILKPSPLHEDEDKAMEWLDYVAANPVPSMLNFYDYDHISEAFDGHIATEEERKPKAKRQTDEDDETPATPVRTVGRSPDRANGSPKPTPRSSVVDDDETVDDETGEITPKKATAKTSQLPDDEAPAMNMSRIKERLAGRRARQDDD